MRADTTVALLALLCLAAGVAAVLAAPAVASHADEANTTIQPEDPASDRAPNASDVTYDTWTEVEESHENLTMIQYRLPDQAFWDCSEDDLRTFGIDRGGDDDGLETDEPLPPGYMSFEESVFIYDAEETFNLSAGDEIVTSIENCLYNPTEADWYQGQVYVSDRHDPQVQSTSHYYWICECDNESEARERLGPPPSETSTTPTPTPTDEPVVTEEQTPEPTKTESDASTATSTKAGAGTPTSTETSRISAASSPTETASADGTASPEQTAGATGTGTATPGESAAVSSAADDEVTPGGGPGFGALVAVLALAAVALLARRRG